MQEVIIIIKQITVLSILGLIGFISGRKKYLPDNSGVIISRVVIKLTLPALIITTLANYSFDSKTLIDGAWVYIFGLVFLIIAYIISIPVSRSFRLDSAAKNIYRMESIFGNVIFLAFPLLGSLYGEKGIIYAMFFQLANDTMLWTVGIYLVNRHNAVKMKDNLKHLVNANTIAFISGLLLIAFNFQGFLQRNEWAASLYDVGYETFHGFGKTTIYLSMIFIGLILSEIKINNFNEFIRRYPLFILSFFKLILVPMGAFIILYLLRARIDAFVIKIVVLQLAMPCGTIVPALAAQYDSDYRFASETVLVSTMLSLITLPFMVLIVTLLLK